MDDTTDKDRRRADRQPLYLVARIEGARPGQRSALTRDVSATGMALLTRAEAEPGSTLAVRVFLDADGERAVTVDARVVRHQAFGDIEGQLWRRKAALEFLSPQPALAAEFERLALGQQAALDRARRAEGTSLPPPPPAPGNGVTPASPGPNEAVADTA